MSYILEHSLDFLFVSIGIALVLFSAGKFVPQPLSFLKEITEILIYEFIPKRGKMPIERINVGIILIFFILALLCALLEIAPSALQQSIGKIGQQETFPYCFLSCLLLLLVSCIVSPTFIWLSRREYGASVEAQKMLKVLAKSEEAQTTAKTGGSDLHS